MRIYYMPINLKKFNLFEKRVDDIEDFLYKDGMQVGDCLLLYVTEKGIEELKEDDPERYKLCSITGSGFYGMARIISLPYISEDMSDCLKGNEVVDAKITVLNKEISKNKIIANLLDSPKGIQYTKPQEVEISVTFK